MLYSYLMSTTGLIVIKQQVLNSLHEFPEDGTGVPKYVRAAKNLPFKCICNLFSKLAV